MMKKIEKNILITATTSPIGTLDPLFVEKNDIIFVLL